MKNPRSESRAAKTPFVFGIAFALTLLFSTMMTTGVRAETKYIHHRGNHKNAPENSIPAFEQAEYWGAETDIRVTKDGRWVIMHDDTVDRTTNGTGRVTDLTFEDVRNLRIDKGNGLEKYKSDQLVVPTLEEYLGICRDKGVVPVIEIKCETATSGQFDDLTRILNDYGFTTVNTRFISFYAANLQHMAHRIPDIPSMLLTFRVDEALVSRAKDTGSYTGIDVLWKDKSVTRESMAALENNHLAKGAWVVPASEFEKMEDIGVEYITTDD